MAEDPVSKCVSVRSIVSIFENKSPQDPGSNGRLKATKSFSKSHTNLKQTFSGEAASYEFGHQDLDIIAQHLKELEFEIKRYELYSKEDHTYFQTELVSVLSEIVNVEGKNDESIARKKKDLILVVRNLNVLLTNKLPGERSANLTTKTSIRGGSDAPRPSQTASIEILNQDSFSASVRNLRRMFEDKCRESDEQKGLNMIVNEPKSAKIKRVMSFGGEACRYKYVPYKDRTKLSEQNPESDKYIVEGVDLKKDRVVHKTNLRRYRSFKEIKITNSAISASKQVPSPQKEPERSVEEAGRKSCNENDSETVVSTGTVSKMIGNIERSISVDATSNSDRHSSSTCDTDIDRKFDAMFMEEVTQYDGVDFDREIETENSIYDKKVVLCNPVQRSGGGSESNREEDVSHVNVFQLIRQLENNNHGGKVLHRTVSSTLPNYVVDSDTSDSMDTIIHCPVSSKTDGVTITEVSDLSEVRNGQPLIFETNGVYHTTGSMDDGEETEDSLIY